MKKLIGTAILTLIAGAGLCAAADGKAAYEAKCKSCHGADGTPNAAIGKMMKVEMKALGSAEVQATSAADLKKIITDGKGKMKAVAGVDADAVVAYVKTLKK